MPATTAPRYASTLFKYLIMSHLHRFRAPLHIDSQHYRGTQPHHAGTHRHHADGRRPCCWGRCHVMLDDHTPGGIRRHLLDRHTHDLLPGTSGGPGVSGPIVCQWPLENGSQCGGSYLSVTTLSRHISSGHMRVGRVTCEWCQTEFSRKDALKRHKKGNCPCRPGKEGARHKQSVRGKHALA